MSGPLGSRVRSSILALQGRQAVLLMLNLGVGIVLARMLEPAVFGLYAIATFCLSLVTMATDFGLAGSLVQRKGDVGHHEISVAFTVQGLVAMGAGTLVWFAAPLSLLVYKSVDNDLVWIIRSLVPMILLSPIFTTAKVQLERELQFPKIAGIDIAVSIVGNTTTLSLVLAGFEVWAFVIATLVATFAGTLISWTLIKHRPSIRFDRALTRELFSFGMFFQFGNIANQAAGWVIPLVSGASLGPAAVGLLTWASSNGRRPLMVVENVMRVAFPHFSRLQDQPVELAKQIDLYLRRLLAICYFWAAMGILLAEPMTRIVYTEKWVPGVLCLQLFALALAFDVANWVGGMSLTAVGGVKATARWTLVKSILAIGGSLVLVRTVGMVGVPVASALASLISGFGITVELRRRVPVSVFRYVLLAMPFAAVCVVHLAVVRYSPVGASWSGWVLGSALSGVFGLLAWREFKPRKAVVKVAAAV
jgi:teichuronic acid exporter